MARRCEAVKLQNARIAASARAHHFDDYSPVPFICECDQDGCREFVTVTLPEYDGYRYHELYLVAAGHPISEAERFACGDGFEAYRLVQRAS